MSRPHPTLRGIAVRLSAGLAILLAMLPAAHANPALWVVRSHSATVYLFGTVHVLPKSISWMDPRITAALAASTELWTEADVGDLSGTINAIRHYGIAAAGETEQALPAEYRTRYDRQVAQSGISPTMFAHARPWLAEILLSTSSMQRAGASEAGVDMVLLGYARDHKLATPAFETVDQQFALLADMPRDAQIALLEDAIDEFDQAGPIFSQLLGAWQSGDETKLDKLINQTMRARNEQVWSELILRRNEKFAEKIGDRLQGAGTAFVAVGAGHLCGRDGIPAILEAHGFSVKPVE